jgi:hypothetical protein
MVNTHAIMLAPTQHLEGKEESVAQSLEVMGLQDPTWVRWC